MKIRTLGDLTEWIWKVHYSKHASAPAARTSLKQIRELVGRVKVDEIDRDTVRQFMDSRSTTDKPNSVRRKTAVLLKMLNEAYAEGLVPRHIKAPKQPRRPQPNHRYLTVDEEQRLQQLMSRVCPEYGQLITVLVDTGLRLGEALDMDWSAIKEDYSSLTVVRSKTGRVRSIPLTKRVEQIFREKNISNPKRLWTVDRSAMYRCWRRARELMGLEDDDQFTPHALRHTFASRLIQRGAPLEVVKTLMGHAKMDQTLEYAHLAPEQYRGAIDVLE